MMVFIDDSGDPGFRIEQGSTAFFIISMVIFTDYLEVERVSVAIKELRRELKWPDDVEFKFYKTNRIYRKKFLEKVNPFNFTIRSLVVDKKIIYSPELKNNKSSFYAYFIKEALKHNDGSITSAKIRIDGSSDRVFRRNFLTYLRRELNSSQQEIMKNCKFVDSKSNVLIQMADMIAGSIGRSYYSDKGDCQEYIAIIKDHIHDQWNFS